MAREFRLEDPGEGIHEAEIVEIDVEPGEEVEDGQVLLSVETDKAAVEIPSPFTGTVEEVEVSVGERVEVGAVLLTYTPEGEEADADEADEADEDGDDREAEKEDEEHEEDEDAVGTEKEEQAVEPDAEEEAGDGAEEDEAGEDEAEEGRAEEDEAPAGRKAARDGPVPASPATRRRARELGVELHDVAGSGPGGRVTRDDLEAFAEERPSEGEAEEPERPAPEEEATPEEEPAPAPEERPAGRPSPDEAAELPDFTAWGEVERVAFQGVRRRTAERMTRSWERIPHVTHMDVADVTELERFRREHQGQVEEAGGHLTLTVFVMKAVVSALREQLHFNASLDRGAGEVILKRYFHFGVAVDTERGLLVPVVRDVDRKSVTELAVEVADLVERTREGEVAPDEMRGATFTITNPGPIGGTGFTPIVNWPQVAILGMGRARLEPVVRGDLEDHEVVPRLRLPLCLGFDHRINDGADAARFVRDVVDTLDDPESFLLSV